MKQLSRTFCPTNTPDLKEFHMKKLHSFAFYALLTPVLTLGAGSLLAQPADQNVDREQQSTQRDKDDAYMSKKNDQSTQRAKQPDTLTAADRRSMHDQSRKQNRGYMSSAPSTGLHASELIGAEVKTTGNENVGPVDDLIIDENGQIVAIVVGAGGFLGMGEKDIAIGWGHVTQSRTSDEPDLRIDLTREELRSAPEFEKAD